MEERPTGERLALLEQRTQLLETNQEAHHLEDDRKFERLDGLYVKTLYALVFLGLGFFLNALLILAKVH